MQHTAPRTYPRDIDKRSTAFDAAAAAFDPAAIVGPMLRRLHDSWRAAAGGADMPTPDAFAPDAIGWAREHLSVHDVLSDGTFRFRIDAPHTAKIYGIDMSGRPLSDYPEPRVREIIARTLARVVATRAPVREMRDIAVSAWRWEYEILLVPLSRDGTRVDAIYSLPQIGAEIRRPL